jgi:protoporphyrinogen oxidase
MARVAIIGAGAMGLAAAYHLLKANHQVDIYEVDALPGGMAAHFDFEGLSIERFYHFICKTDNALFDLLDELDLAHTLRWRDTSMGFFYQGHLYDWGNPLALLRFPGLDWISKLRYGLHAFASSKRNDWRKLDSQAAHQWIEKWVGAKAYEVCWDKLFELKFFEHKDRISAAWIWSRIKRVGSSRKSLLQEELGYLEGGSETLIKRLAMVIQELGGSLYLATPVQRILIEKDRVQGIRTATTDYPYDQVISTIPIPYMLPMVPDLPAAIRQQYAELINIGVVCVVHKLKRSVSPHFWVNINDSRMTIPGIVEFSNLRDVGEDHVVYIPYYMPQTHAKFTEPDGFFLKETLDYLQLINPNLEEKDILASKVGRLRYAQPVCTPGFLNTLPPINPHIKGLQVADTSYYYPEDRGISESVKLAKQMAGAVT